MSAVERPFTILWRLFVEQFAANESATSDVQMRRAIIGVITFLVTPGFFLMMRTMSGYELMVKMARFRNTPEIIEVFLAQMAVLFVSYSMISVGLLTVFIWDVLVFDKRDAMALGPLPLRGRTIVAAKVAALATFLVGTALAVNVISGVSFGFVTGTLDGRILQHLAGHLSGTIGGAVFMFCTLVVVRGMLVLVVSERTAATVGSLLQFVFLSGVLCFMMVPTATGQVIPPISWFAALFEWLRGSRAPAVPGLAQHALVVLPISIAGAVAVTFAGYWKQMRAALAPSARVAATARVRRRLAALITGRDRVARATSDFVLTTLARSRVQQAPIAIAAALGVAIISVALVTRDGGLAELRTPRTVVLWIPIVVGRASDGAESRVGIQCTLTTAFRIVLVRCEGGDDRVRDGPGAARRRGRGGSAARLARGGSSFTRHRSCDRYCGTVCVAPGGRRSVYSRVSARSRETQDAVAPLPARHVGDRLSSGSNGAPRAERSLGAGLADGGGSCAGDRA